MEEGWHVGWCVQNAVVIKYDLTHCICDFVQLIHNRSTSAWVSWNYNYKSSSYIKKRCIIHSQHHMLEVQLSRTAPWYTSLIFFHHFFTPCNSSQVLQATCHTPVQQATIVLKAPPCQCLVPQGHMGTPAILSISVNVTHALITHSTTCLHKQLVSHVEVLLTRDKVSNEWGQWNERGPIIWRQVNTALKIRWKEQS